MRLGTTRNPALTLVLILLTCGIYYLYFIYIVSQETQEFLEERETSPGTEVLLSVVTCGLYNIYWDYKVGKRIAEMSRRVGLPPTDNAVLYLALDLAGFGGFGSLGLVNPVLQQDGLNRIWQAAMTQPPDSGAWPPRADTVQSDTVQSDTVQSDTAPAAPATPMSDADVSLSNRTRTSAGAAFAVFSAVLAASLLLPHPGPDGRIAHLPSVCPFHALTGLPCPGCGLTRAFVCLGHGDFSGSLHWHPLGGLIYAVFLLLWLRSGLSYWRGLTLWPVSARTAGLLGWASLTVLVVTDAARIGWLTAHHLRF